MAGLESKMATWLDANVVIILKSDWLCPLELQYTAITNINLTYNSNIMDFSA